MNPEQIAGNSEHSQQAALYCWAQQNFNRYPELKYMFAIPNGEARTIITGARLKAAGVKSGVPDIFLPVFKSGVPGLFIEMKREGSGGFLSKEQCQFFAYLRKAGYRCEECHGWEEAVKVIEEYLKCE